MWWHTSPAKNTQSHIHSVHYCTFPHRNSRMTIVTWSQGSAHIFATTCPIAMGFGSKWSFLNGQVVYNEKSKLNIRLTYDSIPLIMSQFILLPIITHVATTNNADVKTILQLPVYSWVERSNSKCCQFQTPPTTGQNHLESATSPIVFSPNILALVGLKPQPPDLAWRAHFFSIQPLWSLLLLDLVFFAIF